MWAKEGFTWAAPNGCFCKCAVSAAEVFYSKVALYHRDMRVESVETHGMEWCERPAATEVFWEESSLERWDDECGAATPYLQP